MTLSIPETRRRLRARETTSRQLTEAALAAIEELDGELSSFVDVDRDSSLTVADAVDRAGGGGLLAGVTVGVKDIIDTAGMPTRCGSKAYSTDPVAADATVVKKLREAGAIIVGKTTTHELACGVYSAPASNPWSTDRVPGGSSGGSGAAVAAGIVPIALGSDTGGSIRIPASVCGVAGLKPTYGRVSRAGVEPLSWSLDHIGPLAATVEGCAIALGVLAGPDAEDRATIDVEVPDYTSGLELGVSGMRIGVIDGRPFEPMQPDVRRAFEAAIEVLARLGAEIEHVVIPALEHTIAAEFGIVGPEAAEYHRRKLRDTPELIDPGIRGLLVSGTVLPAGQYLKALHARHAIRDAIKRTFSQHTLDVVLTPTLPATAAAKEQEEFTYDGASEPVIISYVRATAPFNLSGLPALSVPCGFDGGGLPIGLHIAGRPFDEVTVLRVGAAYEAATDWSEHRPPVYRETA